jgi:hypothetical protein
MANITKARIADAAIAYAAAREAFKALHAEGDAEVETAAYHAMFDAEERMLELIWDWNRLQEVLNRNRTDPTHHRR